MSDLLFVYGALRKGASNDWRVEDARCLGSAEVPGTLVKIDWYPGLVLKGDTRVKGEVYEIGPELLKQLDKFEGIGSQNEVGDEYHRIQTDVLLNQRPTKVWIYEWLKGIEDYEVVDSGDWLSAMESDS
ncbi:MAG: gamma-glutamylcyclotransferase family protein [Akkermansiaceae bacterium]